MIEATKAGGLQCANCDVPLHGRFCGRCGEEAFDPHALTVRHFITHTLFHETLHLDGKIWRSLRCLAFRPGFLAAEYCSGRRRLYVNPLRLLITAIIVYALLTKGGFNFTLRIGIVNLSVVPAAIPEGSNVESTVKRIDGYGILKNLLLAKEQSGELSSQEASQKFHSGLEKFAEPLSFANVVLLAVVLYAIFKRKRSLFLEHAVFSMHFLSFALLSAVALLLPALWVLQLGHHSAGLLMLLVGIVWQFTYLTAAIRRFYFTNRAGWGAGFLSAVAALALYVLNSAFVTGVQLIGVALALWSV
jgi:uncharacterized protein DUF3667